MSCISLSLIHAVLLLQLFTAEAFISANIHHFLVPTRSIEAKQVDSTNISRHDFIMDTVKSGAVIASILVSQPSSVTARGRATLEQSYDRYAPRIITGGSFYKNEFKKAIDKNDWAFLKVRSEGCILTLRFTFGSPSLRYNPILIHVCT